MIKNIFLTAGILAIPFMPQAKGITVTRLTCELKDSPALTGEFPRLGWQMSSEENGTRQTAYEIEVYNALNGKPVVSTGKVNSAQSQFVSLNNYKTDNSNISDIYSWRVRVWDEAGEPSAWSKESVFYLRSEGETFSKSKWIGAITKRDARLPEGRKFHGGELRKPEVKAAWENVDTLSKKSICLRREFNAGNKIVRATASIAGLGFYEFSLNGKKVGESEFAPLWSDYDKSVYYNTYDVTQHIRRGENVAGVLLGNGFYNVQGGRYRKLQISFGAPTLIFELNIDYADGTRETICSDDSWKYNLSPIIFNCIYGGEDYDARLEQKGWDKPGFKDNAWRPTVIQEGPRGELISQQADPVKIMEHYGVKKYTKLTPDQIASASKSTKRVVDGSAFVLDMGQNLAGYPEIRVKGRKGQKITLVPAESLTAEGACNQRQTGRQHYYEYTLKGDGVETWHPRFSYYGFRYIQVEGAVMKGNANPSSLPVIENIESCFVYNAAPKVSEFECSNEMFNQTHRLIEKAVRSNMQSVFTDCPHREKLGWLEQVHLNGPGLYYNYDLTSYIPQQMRNMHDSQHKDGAMPTTAPEYVVFEGPGMDDFAQSPEWGSALIITPFMYKDAYGDDILIKKYYNSMRRYVDNLTARADKGIVSFGLGDWYDYGDFKAGFSKNTPVPLVATAQYYMDIIYMIEAANIVGNQADADYYKSLAADVNTAFHKEFFNEDSKQYGTGSQCSNALPLFLDMVSADNRKAVIDNLIDDIRQKGNRLTTGDVGNRYLFQTLARNGLNELMYTMHNHDEAPGYGFQLKFGATTLTEQWDPRQGSSWNHFMMGQIDEWFFRSLAGFTSMAGGNNGNEIEIRPCPVGDLKYVKSSVRTVYGKVAVHWERQGNEFILNVSVPVGNTAKIYMPGSETYQIAASGEHQFKATL